MLIYFINIFFWQWNVSKRKQRLSFTVVLFGIRDSCLHSFILLQGINLNNCIVSSFVSEPLYNLPAVISLDLTHTSLFFILRFALALALLLLLNCFFTHANDLFFLGCFFLLGLYLIFLVVNAAFKHTINNIIPSPIHFKLGVLGEQMNDLFVEIFILPIILFKEALHAHYLLDVFTQVPINMLFHQNNDFRTINYQQYIIAIKKDNA